MRPVGFHTSIKESIFNSIQEAVNLKCDTFQIFLHSPRTWQIPEFKQEIIDEFKFQRNINRLDPFVVHASYLINLLSSNEDTINSSIFLLKKELSISDALDADYYVIHLKDNQTMDKKSIFSKLRESFMKIGSFNKCKILIENTAKSKITARIPDLIETYKNIENENLGGICIDTCHLFAAGYDISEDEGIMAFIKEVESLAGFDLIRLIHLNDSKAPAGSGIDRHEHIGNGRIGIKGIENFLKIKEISWVPLILETPRKSLQDDMKNLETVKNILRKLEF